MPIGFWSNLNAPPFSFTLFLSHFQYHFVTPPPPSILLYRSGIFLPSLPSLRVFALTSYLSDPLLLFSTLFLHFFMIVSLWISLSAKAPPPPPPTPPWPLLSSLLHYITHFHALFHLHAQPTTVYLRPLALPLFLFGPLREAS